MEKIKCFGFDMDYTLAGKMKCVLPLKLCMVPCCAVSGSKFKRIVKHCEMAIP